MHAVRACHIKPPRIYQAYCMFKPPKCHVYGVSYPFEFDNKTHDFPSLIPNGNLPITRPPTLKEQPTLTPVRNTQHRVQRERSPHGAHADGARQRRHARPRAHVVRGARHRTREEGRGRLDRSGVLIYFELQCRVICSGSISNSVHVFLDRMKHFRRNSKRG